MRRKKYDYGACEKCGASMNARRIKQDFWIRGKLILVANVPAGVCPRCGEKIVKADVGLWLARVVRDSDRISKAPTISIPAIMYDPKEAAA
jgi:YgiT-type zinc finger domain-containing protein